MENIPISKQDIKEKINERKGKIVGQSRKIIEKILHKKKRNERGEEGFKKNKENLEDFFSE